MDTPTYTPIYTHALYGYTYIHTLPSASSGQLFDRLDTLPIALYLMITHIHTLHSAGAEQLFDRLDTLPIALYQSRIKKGDTLHIPLRW